jgi:cell envelope opacity-associated protein A
MDKASKAILALQPVTFRYKKDVDPTGTAQFGLVAEDVAKVNLDLVVRDKEGKPYSVRYEVVNAMLLNEFLKEHGEVAELKSTVTEQRKSMEAMAAQLKEQAAQIQKVSAQLEASKPAPQVAKNPQTASGAPRAPDTGSSLSLCITSTTKG